MGFEKVIEKEAKSSFGQYYLRYAQLKELIAQQARAKYGEREHGAPTARGRLGSADLMEMSETPVGKFQDELRTELQKVNQFACVKHEALFLNLRRLCDECRGVGMKLREVKSRAQVADAQRELKELEASIQGCADDIVSLDKFVRLNYTGFQKITQKFDQLMDVAGSALFVSGLHTERFCNVRFDDVLILLGLAWMRWDEAQKAAPANAAGVWKPPESFVRNTAKYWVRPDQVVMLKTRIVKHLPYLIFGASTKEQEELLDPFALLHLDAAGADVQSAMGAYTGTMEESQLLSSVYFDSPSGVSYQERIHREEGARLVRFRWYGENNLERDKEVFIERKIHHEGFGSAQSAKERAILPQSEVLAYMNGKLDIENYYSTLAKEGRYSEKSRAAMKKIAMEVHDMIQTKKLQPIIRTSYYRCAFQRSDDNKVRISLDTQMSLLNEYRKGGHDTEPWCHTSSDPLGKSDVYRFPFAILEIKLQNVSETPQWLRQTLADIQAIQVHKFSKFQHAMAFLHPDKVKILPHWHRDFAEWHEKKDRQASLAKDRRLSLSRCLTSASDDDGVDVPNIRAETHPAGEGHRLKDMQNLDPKGVFANERTLLHYAEKGIYVGGIGIVLVHQEDKASKTMGLVLVAATAVFYVWALAQYFWRLDRIVGRAKVGKDRLLRLDWVQGPLVVGVMVMLVLIISLARAASANMHPRADR